MFEIRAFKIRGNYVQANSLKLKMPVPERKPNPHVEELRDLPF
jgi:hypothetical protein